MKRKHGLSQYRLNSAKDYAKSFMERVTYIDLLFDLSINELINEDVADRNISRLIKSIEEDWKYFINYLEQREDMKQ